MIARQLNEDFDDDSQAVATEIQEQIRAFGDFQAPQTKIEALQARIKTGREKVNKLGARVEVIRKRAEGWAKVEDQWQEKTRKRIKLFWALSATIVVVLVGLLIFQYTPARSPGPSIVDGLNPRAITAGMLDLERGLVNESMEIETRVSKVLEGLRKTPDNSLEDDPRLKVFDEL